MCKSGYRVDLWSSQTKSQRRETSGSLRPGRMQATCWCAVLLLTPAFYLVSGAFVCVCQYFCRFIVVSVFCSFSITYCTTITCVEMHSYEMHLTDRTVDANSSLQAHVLCIISIA